MITLRMLRKLDSPRGRAILGPKEARPLETRENATVPLTHQASESS